MAKISNVTARQLTQTQTKMEKDDKKVRYYPTKNSWSLETELAVPISFTWPCYSEACVAIRAE